MSEILKIAKNGQWSLEKQISRGGEFAGDKDEDFQSYSGRSKTGELPDGMDERGKLHNVGNVRAPRKISESKLQGKVPTPVKSAMRDRNPGLL